MIEKQASCEDDLEPALLPIAVARERILSTLSVCCEHETVSLDQALRRVLAVDIASPFNVPCETNSAMDGFAIGQQSIPISGESRLKLLGTAWAGKPYLGPVGDGEAVRIFTGAVMPAATDTVVIQEHTRFDEHSVTIDSEVVAGKNVRQSGEDLRQNTVILRKGHQLQAADIGVLASLGIRQVAVTRPLKVAFFTTGDELLELETYSGPIPPATGLLFDSNRYTLAAMLSQPFVEPISLGVVRDHESDTREALLHAADVADIIISSGGVSAGDADYVSRVFQDVGEVSFWKIAMRPGRPLAFGTVGRSAFFGLPGNPVAVMVTFLAFVLPAIHFASGMPYKDPLTLTARCQSRLRKSPGRVEYQRGILSTGEDGALEVRSTGRQGAGRLSSMSTADCLIVIESERATVEAGESVRVQPFHGLLS